MAKGFATMTLTGIIVDEPFAWFTPDNVFHVASVVRCAQPTRTNPAAHELVRVIAQGGRADVLNEAGAGARVLISGRLRATTVAEGVLGGEDADAVRRRYPYEVVADTIMVVASSATPAAHATGTPEAC